jgi:1-acyl-sn-glycerol-3-phosphate acyltransferase
MRWFLDSLYRGAERTFGLRVEVEGPDPAISDPAIPGPATSGPAISGPVIPGPVIPESDISESDISGVAARLGRPVIVLSRHAGPGDSLLLVRHLLSVYGRRPRLVLKAELQYDPSVDVVGNRTPNVFVRPRETGEKIFTDEIRRLAGGLDRDGALVIFPEGGNWTPGRWRRGIRRLEQRGRGDLASRARRMPNLLPPRTGGALTAIAACPEADVIFVAHAGLDNLVSLGDVWRDLPVGQVVRARWWRVPFDEVPRQADHEAQVKWLYDWWQRIDSWISEHRPAPSREQAPAELTRPRTSWCEAGDRDARLAGGTEEVPTS